MTSICIEQEEDQKSIPAPCRFAHLSEEHTKAVLAAAEAGLAESEKRPLLVQHIRPVYPYLDSNPRGEQGEGDLNKRCSLFPGRRRLNLHSIYGDFQGSPSVHNLWISDGAKDNVVCRMDLCSLPTAGPHVFFCGEGERSFKDLSGKAGGFDNRKVSKNV